MASRTLHPPLALALLLAPACGPGTDTTDSSTSADTGSATDSQSGSDSGTTAGTTNTPTTDTPTTDTPTTDTPTTDPTTEATTGGAVCPGEFPEDGAPCSSEGLTCGGPCEDPCSFCNLSRCEGGVWMQLEVFPAPCLDCEAVCGPVVAAACTGGPPDQDACVTGCMATQNGECGILYNKTLACIGDMPTFTCDADQRPSVAGCEAQFAELYECQF